MKTPILLCLLVTVAVGGLVEDYQSFNLEANKFVRYGGTTLIGFKHADRVLLEPFMAFKMDNAQKIRRSAFGDSFYSMIPIFVRTNMKLPSNYDVMSLRSFSVKLRPGFASWCGAKCQDVTVSAVRTRRGSFVLLRCKRRNVCKQVLNSLYFNTVDSDMVRKAFQFKFRTKDGSNKYILTKNGLPVYRPTRMPLKDGVWFEGNKLLLYTVKANSGYKAYETFVKDMDYRMPVDGSWPDVYRSRLLNDLAKAVRTSANWEIVAEMRKDDKMVAQLVFDLAKDRSSIDSVNWFSASRLKSSYPYWVPTARFNFFSVAGDARFGRRFFVNHNYGGCPNDKGFWEVSDKQDPCPWGKQGWRGRSPALIYNLVQGTSYQTGRVGLADRFFVYLRYNTRLVKSSSPYRNDFEFERNRLLLYTIKGRIGQTFLSTFNNPGNNRIPDDGRLPLVYRSNYLDEMSQVVERTGKRHVVVEMRKGGAKVAQVKFDISRNARSLTRSNWFTMSRVVSSYPYSIRGKRTNRFSISGELQTNVKRSLYINYNYGGCNRDAGFITAVDGRDVCGWASRFWKGRAPVLLYDPNQGTTWASRAREADRLLIYLQ